MMMRKTLGMATFIAALAMSSMAFAQPEESATGPYVAAGAGYALFNTDNSEDPWSIHGAVGYDAGAVRAEARWDHFGSNDIDGDLVSVQGFLELDLHHNSITPYVGGGAGFYWQDFEGGSLNHDDVALLGSAGVKWAVLGDFYVDTRYTFIWSDANQRGEDNLNAHLLSASLGYVF